MAEKTPNLGLNKPAPTDFVNINDFNENADVLDTEVAERAKKAAAATAGNLAALTADGDLADSGKKADDFVTETDLAAHINNADIHVTALDKINWNAKAKATVYTATIGTTWTGSYPYIQTLTIPGILATDTLTVDLIPTVSNYTTMTNELAAWAEISGLVAGAGIVTVYARTRTYQALNIIIQVVRNG